VIAALELDRRAARAQRALAYALLQVPLAIAGLAVLAALLAGALLSLVAVGLPLLVAARSACCRLVRVDRRAANRLLSAAIPPLPRPDRVPDGPPWGRARAALADRVLLRAVVVLLVQAFAMVVLLAVAFAPLVVLAEILVLGVRGVTGGGDVDYLGPFAFGPAVGAVLLAMAPAAAVLAIAALEGLQALAAALSRAVLARRGADEGPVREMLAESLGDHSVSIAYWLPDRGVFVDEVGRRVELPEPGSGRAWTAVDRDGRRVAAIIHDASLDTTPELVHAAAAASLLAIDNERLKADLRARLEDLRVSRLRIVEATDEARRRIERDLHDGAQQQLVALALELRLLRSRVGEPETRELVDGLSRRLSAALEELRELARGIHPAILTDRGLGPAVEALAERSPVDVEHEVVVDGRLPPAVEAAAYFVVAEGLTNVAKYARVDVARVAVRSVDGELLVTVADDGAGGVDLGRGSGLRGLQDRLAAVGGTLEIRSAAGGGTVLVARIPSADEVWAGNGRAAGEASR
jgi:signal transduction histidine kinase